MTSSLLHCTSELSTRNIQTVNVFVLGVSDAADDGCQEAPRSVQITSVLDLISEQTCSFHFDPV